MCNTLVAILMVRCVVCVCDCHSKLRADMKVTKVDEMHVEIETLYQEVVRLQNTKLSPGTQ